MIVTMRERTTSRDRQGADNEPRPSGSGTLGTGNVEGPLPDGRGSSPLPHGRGSSPVPHGRGSRSKVINNSGYALGVA